MAVHVGLEGAYRLTSPLDGYEASVPAANRAVALNAYADGATGAHIFNYDIRSHRAGPVESQDLNEDHKQLLRDLTCPEALAARNRTYTVTDAMIGTYRNYCLGDPRPQLPRRLPILAFGSGPLHGLRQVVADDLVAGRAEGRIRKIELRLRMKEHDPHMGRIVCEVNGRRVGLTDRPTIRNRWDDRWIVVDDPPVVQGVNTILLALEGEQIPDPWPTLYQSEIVVICQ